MLIKLIFTLVGLLSSKCFSMEVEVSLMNRENESFGTALEKFSGHYPKGCNHKKREFEYDVECDSKKQKTNLLEAIQQLDSLPPKEQLIAFKKMIVSNTRVNYWRTSSNGEKSIVHPAIDDWSKNIESWTTLKNILCYKIATADGNLKAGFAVIALKNSAHFGEPSLIADFVDMLFNIYQQVHEKDIECEWFKKKDTLENLVTFADNDSMFEAFLTIFNPSRHDSLYCILTKLDILASARANSSVVDGNGKTIIDYLKNRKLPISNYLSKEEQTQILQQLKRWHRSKDSIFLPL